MDFSAIGNNDFSYGGNNFRQPVGTYMGMCIDKDIRISSMLNKNG